MFQGFHQSELQQKAAIALQAKEQGDPRYAELTKRLVERTGLEPAAVEERIIMLLMGMNV